MMWLKTVVQTGIGTKLTHLGMHAERIEIAGALLESAERGVVDHPLRKHSYCDLLGTVIQHEGNTNAASRRSHEHW